MIVRHGTTTRDQLSHATERIEAVGGKAVGIVVNLAPAIKKGRSYGYGYGYGYYGYTTRPAPTKAPRGKRGHKHERKPRP